MISIARSHANDTRLQATSNQAPLGDALSLLLHTVRRHPWTRAMMRSLGNTARDRDQVPPRPPPPPPLEHLHLLSNLDFPRGRREFESVERTWPGQVADLRRELAVGEEDVFGVDVNENREGASAVVDWVGGRLSYDDLVRLHEGGRLVEGVERALSPAEHQLNRIIPGRMRCVRYRPIEIRGDASYEPDFLFDELALINGLKTGARGKVLEVSMVRVEDPIFVNKEFCSLISRSPEYWAQSGLPQSVLQAHRDAWERNARARASVELRAH